jgi:hypothetical protein
MPGFIDDARRSDHGNGRVWLAGTVIPVRAQTPMMTSRITSVTDVPIRVASILSSLMNRVFVGRIGNLRDGTKILAA